MTDYLEHIKSMAVGTLRNNAFTTELDTKLENAIDQLLSLPVDRFIAMIRHETFLADYEIDGLETALKDEAHYLEQDAQENAAYARADWELDCLKAEGF